MHKPVAAIAPMAFLSAIAGYILRRNQLAHAFELNTNLPITGARGSVVLSIYIAFVIAAALAVAIVLARRYAMSPQMTVSLAPTSGINLTLAAIIAVAIAFSGALICMRVKTSSKLELALGISLILAGLSIFGLEFENLLRRDHKLALIYTIVPELALTFWLFVVFRANQTNPIRYHYVFQCLAIAASAFAFYYTSSAIYGRPQPARFVLTHVLAIFFLGIGLADGIVPERHLVFGALLLFFAINLTRALFNLTPKSGASVAPEQNSN